MRRVIFKNAVLAVMILSVFTACSQKGSVKQKDLKNLVDSASYCIGANMGSQMKGQNMEINPDILMKAFYATYKGDTNLLIKEAGMQEVMMKYQQQMQVKQQQAAQVKAKPNREKAAKFLADNKTKPGVITTADGLQYKVIKQGSGKKPTLQDRVRIQYRLKLMNGQVVESTFERNQDPVLMGMTGIIKGMQEGLQLMSEGSTYQFWMSPDLGYGDMDNPQLPAGSLLVFEVQLVEVVKDSPAQK